MDHDVHGLLERLVADLRPVRRLSAAPIRALGWLAIVIAIALALGAVADIDAIRHRLMAVPDMWLAVLGSFLTMLLAVFAAFELGLPDRSRLWALLPLPGLALWLSASGLGCARVWLIPGFHSATWADDRQCIFFIFGLSIPLSLVFIVMLRRGYSLTPSLAAALAGLAVASAAATLLNFFHPYDAAFEDLLVHASAVAIVVGLNRIAGGRLIPGLSAATRSKQPDSMGSPSDPLLSRVGAAPDSRVRQRPARSVDLR